MIDNPVQSSDFRRLLSFIKAHARLFLMCSLTGFAISETITFFIPKEYRSYSVVYAPSSPSVENSIDFPNFGYDVEADRLIQILQSSEIRDSVVARFNLISYYQIDTSDTDWLDRLGRKYYRDIKFERTNSMAVLTTARTKNPRMSAEILNYMIGCADRFRDRLYKKNIATAYDQAIADYTEQKKMVDSAEFSLSNRLRRNKLSSLAILMSDAQLSIAVDKLGSATMPEGEASLGAGIISFKSMYEVLRDYKGRYIRIKKALINPIPRIFVINYAEPSFKKVSPSYTVNGLVGICTGLVICCGILFTRNVTSRAN
jgi:hypothetical protein